MTSAYKTALTDEVSAVFICALEIDELMCLGEEDAALDRNP